MLLPITFPKTISDWWSKDAIVLTTNSGADVPKATIARALDITPSELDEQIAKLTDEGVIEDGEVVQEPAVDEELFIVYTYVERSDAPPLKTESRDFCKEMLTLTRNRAFTIDDIEQTSCWLPTL